MKPDHIRPQRPPAERNECSSPADAEVFDAYAKVKKSAAIVKAARSVKQTFTSPSGPDASEKVRLLLSWCLHDGHEIPPGAYKLAGFSPAGGAPDFAALGFVQMDGIEAEPVSWLWTDWIPQGMLTVCDGRPDAGKTTLLCDLAARVTQGRAMPTEGIVPPERAPGAVIFVTSENAFAQVLRPRLEAAGADLSRCIGWSTTPEDDGTPDCPRLPRDAETLAAAVEHYGAALVIVDPLFSHMDGELNPNRETDVRRALVPLARIAEETGAAVVAVRHFNKSANGDAINAGGGSIGIVGTARVQLIVGKPPDAAPDDAERVVAVGKMNIAPKPPARSFTIVAAGAGEDGSVPTSRVAWGGLSTVTASDLTRPHGQTGTTTPARDEVADWLEELLTPAPRLARDVWAEAEELGFAEATVKRAKKALRVNSYRDGFGGPWMWEIPKPKGITSQDKEDQVLSQAPTVIPFENGDPLWADGPENADLSGTARGSLSKGDHQKDMGSDLIPLGDGLPGAPGIAPSAWTMEVPDED